MANLTRQELYDRIKESSKDKVILEEMKRLGFWSEGKPSLSEDLINEETELRKELDQLLKKQRLFEQKDELLANIHQERMKISKERQKVTKEERQKLKEEKAKRWKEMQENDIVFLGEDVSKALHHKELDLGRLENYGVPVINDVNHLVEMMEITLSKLRFLTFHRTTNQISHYKRYYIQKKSGGTRVISSPMPDLKKLQYWVLENILNQIPVHEAAHGFVRNRSIKTNAELHVGAELVINQDLKNFFPSITFERVRGLFRSFGYSGQLGTIFALICTEPEVDEVELDGETYYVAKSARYLPQGAPTSPLITNILCKRLDNRLKGMATKNKFTYSRYADDLTLSTNDKESMKKIPQILWQSKKIVEDESFELHPDKLHVMKNGSRKEVTGVVVNEKINVGRKKLNQFRALLHQIDKDGPEGKEWQGNTNVLNSIKGYADFVNMINPQKGEKLLTQVNGLWQKYDHEKVHVVPKNVEKPIEEPVSVPTNEVKSTEDTQKTKESTSDKKSWWKLW
ncbi:MAG: RNA-directed DNA polymerase [Cytophagales bacterium]|nr:RNA-directed DNA polymerase [Cytophagales bacterium]